MGVDNIGNREPAEPAPDVLPAQTRLALDRDEGHALPADPPSGQTGPAGAADAAASAELPDVLPAQARLGLDRDEGHTLAAGPDAGQAADQGWPPPAEFGTATGLPADATIDHGNFRYLTDDRGRVIEATGTLQQEKADRQRKDAGYIRAMIPEGFNDQAGHLFAAARGGPGDHWNMVPQDANLNHGEWRKMENGWKDALDRGPVEVAIAMSYDGDDLRPYAFHVEYTRVNEAGATETVQETFLNGPGAAKDEFTAN